MTLNAKVQGQYSIYDYSNIFLGGFDNIVQGLLKPNPEFINMDVDLADFVAKNINYESDYYISKSPQIQLSVSKNKSTIKQINGFSGQNIYDLNLMCYSGFDNIIAFIKENNINSINDHEVQGLVANFNTNLNNDLSLNSIILKKGYVFTTGVFINGYRITEDYFFRITEDGSFRMLE
jgi:hypothetical protein